MEHMGVSLLQFFKQRDGGDDEQSSSVKYVLAVGAIVVLILLIGAFSPKDLSFTFFGQSGSLTDPSQKTPINSFQSGSGDGSGEIIPPNPNLVDFTDITVVEKIAALDEDHPVRALIIKQCANNSGPCETSLRPVYVSWPSNQKNYSASKAYVCAGSSLYGKTLLIADSQNERAVALSATGNAGVLKGPCAGDVDVNGQIVNKDNFIQLSSAHLECLNQGGRVNFAYTPRQVKQVEPDKYGEGCLTDLF